MSNKVVNRVVYFVIIILSVLFIWWGNNYATKDYQFLSGEEAESINVGIVSQISNVENYKYDNDMGGTNIEFRCYIKKGSYKGQTIDVVQTIDDYDQIPVEQVKKNNKVIVYDYGDGDIQFTSYERTTPLIWLTVLFVLILLAFGRMKGFNTVISLALTCMVVFFVFIPVVLSGHNIYMWSIIVCLYVIIMTFLIVNGAGKKSLAAGIGCACGVLLAGGLTQLMNIILRLTGITDESAYYLTMINPDKPIDLKAIIFAAIIIGAVGAIMDVAMSISAALHELNEKAEITRRNLVLSGFTIGRDMMGTMANTLILAYIGSSLSVALLLVVYNGSMIELMNREMVIVEVLQALVGSIGILFTIPFTTVVCAWLFKNKRSSEELNYEKDVG